MESIVDAQGGLETVMLERESYRGPWSMEKAREGLREPERAEDDQVGVKQARGKRAKEGWRGPGKGKEGQ